MINTLVSRKIIRYRKDINMTRKIKVTINRKDLYSKEYNNSKMEGDKNNVVVIIKKGLVDILVKISQEEN
ncbi:hypothetical protein ERM65_02040 [Clostridioides difficile]|nr:hypothetical protein [Clostridioides difficile]EGT4223735.1 hypothetical protein [Clostridioides difficile]EGT4942373.1 hypothetical protein [Clostridioides difficile]